jgi:general secretion pathway protein A
MYDAFYDFREEPFRLSPDHHFAYEHRGYKKARAYMAYAFMRAEGFVMVTGRPGTGKTTLVGNLIEDLARESVQTASIVCSQLQADDLLTMVAHEFGAEHTNTAKGQLLSFLKRQFEKWHREGRRALLIVDEAQDLSVNAMEELRLLTNIQADRRPLLQIFLLGQPELRELILSPPLEQVHQRIVAASHLQPLEEDETRTYINHRLAVVGWKGNPQISEATYALIHRFSEGVPRRINLICSRLFLHGAIEERRQLGVEDLREVIIEMQGESLATGNTLSEHDFDIEDVFEDPESASFGKPPTSTSQAHARQSDDALVRLGGSDSSAAWSRRMRRRARST